MTDSADVFLSYKAEDRPRLKPLVAALEAEGFSVWWDANIGGGTDWREDIQEHLDAAKCVIVAWSKRTLGPPGRFVRDEAARAAKCGSYLPVRLDAVDPPLGFGEIQALSLERWKGDRSDPRFQAVVGAVRACISGEHFVPTTVHYGGPLFSRRAAMAGGAGIVTIAGAGGWALLKPAPANAKRIAVLPFASLSADQEQAYFSEGVAEELRAALSRVGLEVIGRASSDAVKSMDTKQAASKLGVANILSGTVRRSAETIRINAQLVSGKDGVERWARSYDRAPGDAIKIQTDIATNVAEALSIALGQAGRAALTLGGTADSKAQDLAMQARDALAASGSDSLRKALDLLDAALVHDPNYANAHVQRAHVLDTLAAVYAESPAAVTTQLAQAEQAAKRALAIEPKLGSAYSVLGTIEAARFDFASALQLNQRSLALSPDSVGVLSRASLFEQTLGDPRKALRLADRAIVLDPLSGISYLRRAQVLQVMRHYTQAIAASRKGLSLEPQLSNAHGIMGQSFTLMGQYPEARAEYQQLPADGLSRLIGEGFIAARTNDVAGAERAIAQLKQQYGASASYQYAEIYAQLQDRNRAFSELQNAVEAKDPGLVALKSDPFLDPVRSDPRYAALLKRLKFP